MSRIDSLIADLCPEGVRHADLGEVGQFVRGAGIQKTDLGLAGRPAIHYGQIFTHYGVFATVTKSFIDDAVGARRWAEPGDLVIATTSENDEDVCKAVAWIGGEPAAVSSDSMIYSHTFDPKFIAYWFQSTAFQDQKARFVSGTKVKRVSAQHLSRIVVPVPPLEVQRAIVEVLDTFTELETELEAELEARRRQYAHYRDALLGSTTGDQRSMGDVGEFVRGRRFTKSDYVEAGGIPSIHYGEIYTDYGIAATETVAHVRAELRPSLRFAAPGDVVIAGVGETVEDVAKAVAWLGEGEVAIHDDCFAYRHSMDPRFVSYWMQTSSFNDAKERYVARGKNKRISAASLGKLLIPVPPPHEQRRIADTLDAFEALVNDISIGLPAEISARRTQYEHYRDRLLTFPEEVAV